MMQRVLVDRVIELLSNFNHLPQSLMIPKGCFRVIDVPSVEGEESTQFSTKKPSRKRPNPWNDEKTDDGDERPSSIDNIFNTIRTARRAEEQHRYE